MAVAIYSLLADQLPQPAIILVEHLKEVLQALPLENLVHVEISQIVVEL